MDRNGPNGPNGQKWTKIKIETIQSIQVHFSPFYSPNNHFFHSIQNMQIENTKAGPHWARIGIKQHHGLNIPLFALRSANSTGIGEFPDLIPLMKWCREIGMDILQLLPLNDTGNDTSPYSIISAFALNPIYLNLSQLPYVNEKPVFQNLIRDLRERNQTQRIDYPSVQKLKRKFLILYYNDFSQNFINTPEYHAFIKSQDWLQGYALFKTLKEAQEWKPWEDWDDSLKHPNEQSLKQLYEEYVHEINFHIFVQYLCFKQFEDVKKKAEKEGIFLKGDIPILISRESADVWLNQSLFDLSYNAGSPPDMYNWEGQVWGFPIYNWVALKNQEYQWWKKRLKLASSLYHLYRLDHVVGFFRIWAVPLGMPGKLGNFIPEDEKTWVAHGSTILNMMLESSPMLPIAEDLGTVPPPSRKCLKELGISGTRVMRWERMWDEDKRFIKFEDYQPLSMTTVSTHDSETLQQWWKNNPKEVKEFCQFLQWTYTPKLSLDYQKEILKHSHRTSSLFHINLLNEYLALFPQLVWDNLEDERINRPGIVSDTNWTYRFRPKVEEIISHEPLKKTIKELVL